MSSKQIRLRKLSLYADELASAGKVEAARIALINGLELASEVESQAFFYFFRAELDYLDDRLLVATEGYRKAYELAPQNPLIIRGLAVSYSRRKLFKKAQGYFSRGLRIAPHDHHLWRQAGVTYSRMRAFDKAITCFQQATQLNNTDYHSFRQWGVTLMQTGQSQEALPLFAKALQLNQQDFRALYEHSKALHQLGHTAESVRLRNRSKEVQHQVTRISFRETFLARLKLKRIRENQERILAKFNQALKSRH